MKNDLIKASAAIHLPHILTLDQQRAWNVLLANAFPRLGKEKLHTITEKELLSYYPYEHRHTDRIKKDLDVICRTTVTYNIFNKDHAVWGVFAMLAEAKLENGILTYAYAPTLSEKLQNPAIYTKINLLIQQKFSSKHALTLYELCLDYIDSPHGFPKLSLEEFRKYMGIAPHEYPVWNNFKIWVLRPAIKEINKSSNILVKEELIKTGRKVTHIKFNIRRKKDAQLVTPIFEHPAAKTSQETKEQATKQLTDDMRNWGLSEKCIDDVIKEYNFKDIWDAMTYLASYKKPIENRDGFLIRCLERKWWGKKETSELPYDPKKVR